MNPIRSMNRARCPDQPKRLIDAIAFNIDPNLRPNPGTAQVKIVYQLTVNEYRDVESVQLLVKHIETVGGYP